jgi:non-homologous end joining protein Ku
MVEILCNYEDTLIVEPLHNRREIRLATNCYKNVSDADIYLDMIAAKKLVKELQDIIEEQEESNGKH